MSILCVKIIFLKSFDVFKKLPIFALRFGGTAKEESESPERIKEKTAKFLKL